MQENIYIVSLSPTIDYILLFDELVKNKTNRPKAVEMYPSGKGIHISMMLNNLNVKNESLIFTNGDFENYFYKELDKNKISYKKFKSKNNIRVNLKLIDAQQTECSVESSSIDKLEINKLINYLKNNLKKNDYLVLTGSIPKEVDKKIYSELVELSNSLKVKCIVDSYGEALNYAIDKKPFLIKPNLDELKLTLGIEINNINDVIKAGKKILERGVENILISMGADGAILINDKITEICNIGNWNYKLINAAGAGDSMIAGFLFEFIKTKNYERALKMGVACGSATAFSTRIGNKKLAFQLFKSILKL
ncbi:1-phosphofructokinase family hexose kinase [Spiroplasma cantharicola]|uniref:1-phosphofructokinase n=1 Tax=Spiroplasma cantharicola TaxID=362837 RepID=A0A0M3SJD9_9MOLU|nr:1-phosphofructokinase family hexose kinase [Spiroplasma cantharicola]ALD66564.1 1-phosphofructokinase [Spiroplasma cantharicola]